MSDGWHLVSGTSPNACRVNNQCTRCWLKDRRVLYHQMAFSPEGLFLSFRCLHQVFVISAHVYVLCEIQGWDLDDFLCPPLCSGQAFDKYLLQKKKKRKETLLFFFNDLVSHLRDNRSGRHRGRGRRTESQADTPLSAETKAGFIA